MPNGDIFKINMKNHIAVNFCPTGMVPTKKETPHVPIDVEEIIEQTHEAYEKGITIVHLHARDKAGLPTHKKEVYGKIFEGVRKHCSDLIICGSTSGRDVKDFERRSEVIELKPDMCSLTLSSLNFLKQASLNAPDMILKLLEKMNEYNVTPELECFDLGMINFGKYLKSKNLIKGSCYWNIIFGNIAGMQANAHTVAAVVSEIGVVKDKNYISFGGIGKEQLKANELAIVFGYGVRVGIEDNIWFDSNKRKLATNLDLIDRVHNIIKINELEVYKPAEFKRDFLVCY